MQGNGREPCVKLSVASSLMFFWPPARLSFLSPFDDPCVPCATATSNPARPRAETFPEVGRHPSVPAREDSRPLRHFSFSPPARLPYEPLQMSAPPSSASPLVRIGRRIFSVRLFIGLGVVLLSIRWLRPLPFFDPRYHGMQILALMLIACGLGLRAWGAGSAGHHTRTARIEAPRLISGGPFAYLRNPIYAGTIALSLGMAILIGDPKALLCAAFALGLLYVFIVPAEEAFLRGQFGAEYARYCDAVPRLIPRLSPWPGRREQPFEWQAARGELRILLILVLIYGGLLLVSSLLHA